MVMASTRGMKPDATQRRAAQTGAAATHDKLGRSDVATTHWKSLRHLSIDLSFSSASVTSKYLHDGDTTMSHCDIPHIETDQEVVPSFVTDERTSHVCGVCVIWNECVGNACIRCVVLGLSHCSVCGTS